MAFGRCRLACFLLFVFLFSCGPFKALEEFNTRLTSLAVFPTARNNGVTDHLPCFFPCWTHLLSCPGGLTVVLFFSAPSAKESPAVLIARWQLHSTDVDGSWELGTFCKVRFGFPLSPAS